MLQFMGCKESDMTEGLNWTEYSIVIIFIFKTSCNTKKKRKRKREKEKPILGVQIF